MKCYEVDSDWVKCCDIKKMSEVLENIFALGEVFENTFLGEVLRNNFTLGEVFENTFHESES